jgi:hypothetical protein
VSTSIDPDTLLAELTELGNRRQKHEDEDAELAEEIRQALARVEATNGAVSKVEAARRLKMHRTTLYRVYGPD